MPAKSEKQLKLIYAIRNKYKSKAKSPKKWKWVWGEEWGHMESHILTFKQFEGISNFSTVPMEDLETVEDILMELVDKWDLSLETHDGYNGYVSVRGVNMGKKPIIDIGIQLNRNMKWENIHNLDILLEFERDLKRIIDRLEKFGFKCITSNYMKLGNNPYSSSSFEGFLTYTVLFDTKSK